MGESKAKLETEDLKKVAQSQNLWDLGLRS